MKKELSSTKLLVGVILIIILSVIIVSPVSFSSARNLNDKIKEEMNKMILAGEEYFSTHNNYGVQDPDYSISCIPSQEPNSIFNDKHSKISKLLEETKKDIGLHPDEGNINLIDCGAVQNAWSIATKLPNGGVWCVDNTGVARDSNEDGVPYECVSQAICYPPHSFAHQGIGYTKCL